MLIKAIGAIRGLASDPLTRVSTLERITEYFLWKLPRKQIDQHLEIPVALPQRVLDDARLFADRETMLHALPKGGTVAEIGTLHGTFSRAICETCHPKLLHLIDLDFSQFDWDGLSCKYLVHKGDSSTIVNSFAEKSLDWAYIDGDHSYSGARKDIEAAHLALKPGGYLMCNDYTNWCSLSVVPYGVARAVNDLVIEKKYSVAGFAFHPAGNSDLLIRKP